MILHSGLFSSPRSNVMQSDTHSLTSQFACPAQIPCKRDRLLKLLEYAFLPQNVRTLSGTAPNRKASSPSIWWAVSIGPFQVGRSRLRRMRFAMGIQSYFCCLTASRLPGNGIVERSSRSRWLHYAPGAKVLRTRKCPIVGTRSVRRASGLLETGFSVTSPVYQPVSPGTYRYPDFAGAVIPSARARV